MTISIRKATTADADYARKLHHAAYREIVTAQFGEWDDQVQDRFFDGDWHDASFDILLCDGEPCGYAAVEERSDDIHVRELVVDPARQGLGIGSAFVRLVMDRATIRGVPVRLGTCLHNRAVNLYRRLGFHEFERSASHVLLTWHGR